MEEPSLEALMQAGLISVVCAAIILSNLFIVAAYLMYRGKFLLCALNIMFIMLTSAAQRNRANALVRIRPLRSSPCAHCTIYLALSFPPHISLFVYRTIRKLLEINIQNPDEIPRNFVCLRNLISDLMFNL